MHQAPKIILGIDPGTLVMGYGLILIDGNSIRLLKMDVLKMPAKLDPYARLEMIHRSVCALIIEYKPQHFAIEAPFFGKNVQSMLKLGRAQGVAIAAAMQSGLPISEYSPKKVKQSITGNGNADKEQVWKMLQHIIPMTEDPKYLDASDALAVAVCHHFQGVSISNAKPGVKKLSGWADFAKVNAARVR